MVLAVIRAVRPFWNILTPSSRHKIRRVSMMGLRCTWTLALVGTVGSHHIHKNVFEDILGKN